MGLWLTPQHLLNHYRKVLLLYSRQRTKEVRDVNVLTKKRYGNRVDNDQNLSPTSHFYPFPYKNIDNSLLR